MTPDSRLHSAGTAGSPAPPVGGAAVRIAGTADADALGAVAAATFALACPPGTLQRDIDDFLAANLSIESFARYIADPSRVLLLAESAGSPVGYTMLVVGEPDDPDVAAAVSLRPTAELSKCYVLPQQHGTGVASLLLERSVDEARARGAASVWLGVNQRNSRANRFYEKSGFRIVGTKRFRVGAVLHDDFVRERTT